jgi:hypothetical protein
LLRYRAGLKTCDLFAGQERRQYHERLEHHMRRHLFLSAVTALLSVVVCLPARAAEPTLPRRDEPGQHSLTLGAEYTRGSYGSTSDTTIGYFPLIYGYEHDRWLLRVTVPFLAVRGPDDALIVGGMGSGMGGGMGGAGADRTASGIGDVAIAISYTLQDSNAHRPMLGFTGKAYLGTADTSTGLGTGENDYAAQLDAAYGMGPATLFGSLGYRVTGNAPTINYEDIAYGTLGLERAIGRQAMGVALDAHQAYLPGGDTYATLTGYLVAWPATTAKLTVYLLLGLSDTAPDWGGGVTAGWYF